MGTTTRVSLPYFVVHAALVLVFCFSFQFVPKSHGARAARVAGKETDREALLEFKSKITVDPFGVLGSWNESSHFCKWHGVSCGHKHQRVTTLDLRVP